jgi:hypothetical protein
MKLALRTLIVASVIAMATVPVRADSWPVVQGAVSGFELCPQSICTVAVFTGVFKGQFGFIPNALGLVSVAVHHGELPVVKDACTPVQDGRWKLLVGFRRLEGDTAGRLCYNGDNTFHISVRMDVTDGGIGWMRFEGTLDHNVFPPTVKGAITQH